jgi:uncharacterized membrane protein
MKLKYTTIMLIAAVLLFMLVCTAQAATLQGVVYDYTFNRIDNVQVQLGGEKDITENGEYSFEVGPGTHTVTAKRYSEAGRLVSTETDTIEIKEDKVYVLDLILFESLDEAEQLLEETDLLDVSMEEEPSVLVGAYLLLFRIFIVIVIVYVFFRIVRRFQRKTKPLTKQEPKQEKTADDADEVLKFIKEQGGRVTQLDIRKKFPSSEAKISLIITDLEEQGKVKKIKKGRGNIIILK